MAYALTRLTSAGYAGSMTGTVTEPTHEQGLAVFNEVIQRLQGAGFERLRVDTLQHYTDAGLKERTDRWTVRHHYTQGVWELHYEPDQTWSPVSKGKHPLARMVRIRLDKKLPTTVEVIMELFGPAVGRYFPAPSAGSVVPAQRRRPSRSLRRETPNSLTEIRS